MRFYNITTDTIATYIKPYFIRGKVDHYQAKCGDTGKKFTIGNNELKSEWIQERHIDIEEHRTSLNGEGFDPTIDLMLLKINEKSLLNE